MEQGTLTLQVPARLRVEIQEWAKLRHVSEETAAVELMRVGIEATSERAAKALQSLQDVFAQAERRRS